MKTAIRITDLTHSFGEAPILDGLSFSICQGDFFVIIGPNGSGKTTLMKTIAGIITPQAGHINIFDRSSLSIARRSLAKTLAYVPQTAPVDFPFTVFEVVMFGRAPHLNLLGIETSSDIEAARHAMEFTGVEHLADRRLTELSGGEIQMVFIARAICQSPKIILLDEPTASLDLSHQVLVMDLMERHRRETDITVVMISHDINLAAMYGEHLMLLKAGRIISMGTPHDVLTFQRLEEAYGCVLLVDKNPLGNSPRVTPVPKKYMIKT